MKIITLLILFSASHVVTADGLSHKYWSHIDCDKYIYHINTSKNHFEIFSEFTFERNNGAKRYSYSHHSVELIKKSEYIYTIPESNDMNEAELDISSKKHPILRSKKSGNVSFIKCESSKAESLIKRAKIYYANKQKRN